MACPLGTVQRCGQHEGCHTQPKNWSEAYYDSWVSVVLYSLNSLYLVKFEQVLELMPCVFVFLPQTIYYNDRLLNLEYMAMCSVT